MRSRHLCPVIIDMLFSLHTYLRLGTEVKYLTPQTVFGVIRCRNRLPCLALWTLTTFS